MRSAQCSAYEHGRSFLCCNSLQQKMIFFSCVNHKLPLQAVSNSKLSDFY